MIKSLQINFLYFFPAFLFAVNIITKLLYLTAEDICIDEPFSIYHAQFDLGTIIEQLKNYNNPPLFELILHLWIKLFGISALAVRSLPLIFAALCPVVLYFFCKKNFGATNAVVSSLMLSASSLLFFYAHDCRVYSLFLLLSMLSMHTFLDVLTATRNRFKIVSFISVNVLLMYAHYFGLFVLFFQGAILVFFYRNLILKFLSLYLFSFLFYLPQVYVVFARTVDSVKNGTWVQTPNGIESLYNMLWAFSNEPFVTVVCITVLVAGLFFKGIKNISTTTSAKYLLVTTWFLFPFLGLFFISYSVPVYISRYLLFALPSYYILIVLSIETICKKLMVKNIILALITCMFFISMDFNPSKKRQIKEAMPLIHSLKDPQTLVVVAPRDFLTTFCYHYDPACFSAIGDNNEYVLTDSLLKANGVLVPASVGELNEPRYKKYKKIIYFSDGNNTFQKSISDHIQKQGVMRYSRQFNNYYKLSYFIYQ